ncbi:MAG: hypothetical protein HYW01_08185 [Deltaproteobacteria bacterium]|nr:hypothetical protein [Deltaproteobacteria bacterium]
MGRESKEISKKRLILWGILAGFIGTFIMTSVMYVGRFKLGTPLIPELISQKLLAGASPEAKYTAYFGAMAIHLVTGTLFGALFIYFLKTAKIKYSIKPVLLYSIFLWFIFSTVVLPLLGFGFFGKYLAGIPAIGEAALLIFYLLYGLTLYLFSLRLNDDW